jgi:oligopeptide transport system substrate-binding protein
MKRLHWVPMASLLLIAACGQGADRRASGPIGGESGTELAEVQVIHWGNGADPGTLDPHKSRGVPSSNIGRDLFEGLVNEAPNGDLIPGVAESWDISEDGRTYTFHLRDNARWSNGDPVTAHDFVYSLRRSVDPATLSNYGIMLRPILNAAEVIAGELPPEALGRARDRRSHPGNQLRQPDALLPRACSIIRRAYPCTAPPSRRTASAGHARPAGLERRLHARRTGWCSRISTWCANPYYWDADNVRLDEVWFYRDREPVFRTAALSGRRARHDLRSALSAAALDP